jgi:hypothetical protein
MLAGAMAPLVGLRGYFALNSALLLMLLVLWTLRGPGVTLAWGWPGRSRRGGER